MLKEKYWILRIGLMGRCQKVPKFDFQSQYVMSKIIEIFLIFFIFHWRISIQEHIFCYWHTLITLIFKSLYFLKWCPIFDTSPLTQFPKFNNFFWVCWFLGKLFSNFIPPLPRENSTTRISILGLNGRF